jgi:hypothetical protein
MNPMKPSMKLVSVLGAAAALLTVSGCDKVLNTEPYDRVSASGEIVDASTARAALNGAYATLQSTGMYGQYLLSASALTSHESEWTGTFQYLGDMATNIITADNTAVTTMWNAHYVQIDRDNTILQRVPAATGIPAATSNEIVGQAYFLRALSYSNLVKYWGPVPMPLVSVTSPNDARDYTRAAVADVYTQILSDLDKAAQFVKSTSNTRMATVKAVQALRARVFLYRASIPGATTAAADYQSALGAANATLGSDDALHASYASLFTADGTDTPDDIFRVAFTASEASSLGNYYLQAGRFEAGATTEQFNSYEAGDIRRNLSMSLRSNSTNKYQNIKFPTRLGTEDPHVIRKAEVMLIKAEAMARLNDLPGAVAEYNKVRGRATLPPHVLGVNVTTQADVLAAIDRERRSELAFEGDRFPNLVREGQAVSFLGIQNRTFQTLFPIPIAEIATSPKLTQNPGY